MIDTATNWFYGERRLSVGAAIEGLRHDLWAWGYYNVWLRLVRSELPYLASGLYNGEKFELEFEPRQYAIIRAANESEWLIKGFTRALGMKPHFQYQDKQGQFVTEWRMSGLAARWSSMQGVPVYKNAKRLYVTEE
ncbi:MAG: hypothetical protein HGB05_04105 [Chloroflexi bacterium]|jgi:hypothetical protein|nr:hypothetical protein [Chloroflexota bacterium]